MGQMSRLFGGDGKLDTALGFVYLAAALFVGSATVWIGPENPLALVPAVAGIAVIAVLKFRRNRLR